MKDAEVAAIPAGTKILHIPTALGAVVVIFNVPGVDKLTARRATTSPASSSATITKWNDPKIAANNAGGRHCPTRRSRSSTAPTARARRTRSRPTSTRSAPSGTRRSARARKSSGRPAIGAQGNDGVAGRRQADATGASGYVELQYATTARPDVGLRSRTPTASSSPGSTDGVTAAAEAAATRLPGRLRARLRSSTAPAPTTYPIAALHLPPRLRGPEGRRQGQGPRLLHRTGPSPTARTPRTPRLRAAPSGGPAEGARRSSTRSPRAGRRSGPDPTSASVPEPRAREPRASAIARADVAVMHASAVRPRARASVVPIASSGRSGSAIRRHVLLAHRADVWRRARPGRFQFGLGFITGTTGTRSQASTAPCRSSSARSLASLIAIVIAAPIGILTAIFLAELAPRRVAVPLTFTDRAAGGDPERRLRPVGRLRPQPVPAGHGRGVDRRACSAGSRSSPARPTASACSPPA